MGVVLVLANQICLFATRDIFKYIIRVHRWNVTAKFFVKISNGCGLDFKKEADDFGIAEEVILNS